MADDSTSIRRPKPDEVLLVVSDGRDVKYAAARRCNRRLSDESLFGALAALGLVLVEGPADG